MFCAKSQGCIGLCKQDTYGCIVLQLFFFYSVYNYPADRRWLTDGICGSICQSHSKSFWGSWGPLQCNVMQFLGFFQLPLPLPDPLPGAFIAVFRYWQELAAIAPRQGLPYLLAALLTLASANWYNRQIGQYYFFVPVKFQHRNYFSSGSCPVHWVNLHYFCPGHAVEPVALARVLPGARHMKLLKKLREKGSISSISILQSHVSLQKQRKKEK